MDNTSQELQSLHLNRPKQQVLLKIAYHGSYFSGMAFNNDQSISVEKTLFEAMQKVHLIPADHSLKSINFSRCGRTDAGVSATGNYVSVFIIAHKAGANIASMLNPVLPSSIRVLKWAEVDRNFNARFQCVRRVYKYGFIRDDLDVDAMRAASLKFVGHWDFRNFCRLNVVDVKNFERTIFDCSLNRTNFDGLLEFMIEGSGFLRQQVRYMVAILFLVGKKLEQPEIIDDLLNIKKFPSKPVYGAAPPYPLRLHDCTFKDQENIIFMNADSFLCKNIREAVVTLKRQQTFELNFISSLLESIKIDDDKKMISDEREGVENKKSYEESDSICISSETYEETFVKKNYKFMYTKKNYVPIRDRLTDLSYKEKVANLNTKKKARFIKKWGEEFSKDFFVE